MDRLIGILSLLLQRERVTAAEMAELFEVSRRTVLRDVDELCRAGIPLVTIQGAGGGISIMDGYRLDRTVLTSSEMQAILRRAAQSRLGQRHTALCPAHGKALSRLRHARARRRTHAN